MKKTGLMSKIAYSKMTSIFLLFFLSAFIILSMWFHNKLNQSQKRHYSSYVAADELRQSSDDLTRMVRTYVVTKDSRYEKMYWDILAIRNGEKARPVRYENIYWDFMAFTNEKPRPDGQKISLLKIMENLEFTKEEFELLAKAEMYSSDLVRTEMIAMHAMKGEFLDTQGEFTIRGEQDYEYARALLHDEAYHSKKVDIMTPIDEFFVMVNARTEAQVNRDKIYTYIFISLVCMMIILLLWLSKAEMNKLKQTEKERECIIAELEDKSRELEKEIKEHKRDEEKLKASNQQLRAGEQQLRAEISERKKMGKERETHRHDLEVFYKANIGREERVVELKKMIKELEEKLTEK